MDSHIDISESEEQEGILSIPKINIEAQVIGLMISKYSMIVYFTDENVFLE
jgi:hypothetical protein